MLQLEYYLLPICIILITFYLGKLYGRFQNSESKMNHQKNVETIPNL